MAKKSNARKSSTKSASSNARNRMKFEDTAKIKVVGEHTRREGSRYFGGFEAMKKISTVAGFRKKRPDDAQELLRAAVKDGYIKVA